MCKSELEKKWEIDGDIKITVKRTGPIPKTLFYVWFPTMCLSQGGVKSAQFKDLDKPYSHMRGDPQNLKVNVQFEKLDSLPCETYNHYRNTSGKQLSSQLSDCSELDSPPQLSFPSLKMMGNQINNEGDDVLQQLDLCENIWDAELFLINCQKKARQTNFNLSMLVDAEKQRKLHRVLTPSQLSLFHADSSHSSQFSPSGEEHQSQEDFGHSHHFYQHADRSSSTEELGNFRSSFKRLQTLPSLEVFHENEVGDRTEDSSDDGNKSPLSSDHSASLNVQKRVSFC
eukprot:TRINITY_DN37412_c1_g1_i1.p1 TRINITY_DN37412_c1_g1~~TRINITY_DN37412_c1_g1_i1.p1  ORF type:complete len:285 (-),score=36.51 TRINITY_DN37412_c1_g1_i1:710-1564(-)